MSVPLSAKYLGDLRCEATHGPSQAKFLTDAPVDNQGKGESFSPTDLVATALGTCMATTMAIVARRHGIELPGVDVIVVKEMTTTGPRRIARLTTELRVPLLASHPLRAVLEGAARGCPVHGSLHPSVELPITFVWQEEE